VVSAVTVALTGPRPAKYVAALQRAGAAVRTLDVTWDADDALGGVGGLVLGGGPDVDPARYGEDPHGEVYGVDPDADALEVALFERATARGLPVLAICRGLQVVNVARGGTLHQHIPDDPGVAPHGRPGADGGERAHEVDVDGGSRLASVLGATRVVASCHHHQAVAKVGEGLRVVARAADGIVEGLEPDGAPGWLVAVQWHPEDTAADDPVHQRLFDALVEQARARR
jgi:putative glutamine amidotransferase